jgi:hypothetical protein
MGFELPVFVGFLTVIITVAGPKQHFWGKGISGSIKKDLRKIALKN